MKKPIFTDTFKDEASFIKAFAQFIQYLDLVVDISEKQMLVINKALKGRINFTSLFKVLNEIGYDVEIHIKEKL